LVSSAYLVGSVTTKASTFPVRSTGPEAAGLGEGKEAFPKLGGCRLGKRRGEQTANEQTTRRAKRKRGTLPYCVYHEWEVQPHVPILERVLEKVERYLGLKKDTCKGAFLLTYQPGFKHGAFWHIDTEVAGNSVVIALKPGAECDKGDLIMSRHPIHHAPDKWKSVEGKDEPGDMFRRCRLTSGSAIRFCRGTPHMVPAVKRTEERATLNLFY